ncbi:proton-conducting transporter membrane subunit [Buchnera aphidicola]|uniref:proton-conducting transporter transmembrane domain-containing protein n=1 Tax=Buchnera aphidicola TaxID=9 RepID=UPI0030ED0EA1
MIFFNLLKYTHLKFINLLSLRNCNFFLINLFFLSAFFTILISYFWNKKKFICKEEFYLLVIFSIIGGYISVISNNFISMFIGIELFSISFLGLISFFSRTNTDILKFSLKYFIISSLSAIFLLLGICIFYFCFGTLTFNFETFLCSLKNSYFFIKFLGIISIIFALFLKISIFPFHFWLLELYKKSSFNLLIYYNNAVKIVYFLILLKLLSFIVKKDAFLIQNILEFLSIFSIIYGSYLAIFQNNIKKLLAYLSISSLGYLSTVLILFSPTDSISTIAIKLYFLESFVSSIILFSSFSILEYIYSSRNNVLSNKILFYKGLFWKQPILSTSIIIAFLSNSGIPFTLGFISKFYFFLISIKKQFFTVSLCMCISSIINIYIYLNLILTIFKNNFFESKEKFLFNINKKLFFFKFFVLIFSIFLIFLGIFPQYLI